MTEFVYRSVPFQIPSETLNLTICEVMINFINEKTLARPPSWLRKILIYFSQALGKESLVIAVNTKQIVKILDVFYKAGLIEGKFAI